METNKLYLARNEEGFLCAYDKETHKCVGIIVGTGEQLSDEKKKEILGTLDPKIIK